MTHAQALIGIADGTYQRALGDNVKIDAKIFNAGPSVIEALFAGQLDLSFIGPNPAINGGNLRCKYDESGRCIELHPCYNDYRTDMSDDCLSTIEERGWSSPIYIDLADSAETAAR